MKAPICFKSSFLVGFFAFLLMGIPQWSYGQNTRRLNRDLIARYLFNRDAKDASGNNNHGNILGNVTATEDRFGNKCGAMFFDGQSGFVSVPSSPSLELPYDQLTITAWFKLTYPAEISGLKWATICCKSDLATEDNTHPQYRLQPTEWTVSVNTEFTESYETNFGYDTWYFYAVTYDGQTVRAYLDGQKGFEFDYYTRFNENSSPLEIGRDVPGNTEYLHGSLDDLRIYNRALSDAEINKLFLDQSDSTIPNNPCAPIPPPIDPAPTNSPQTPANTNSDPVVPDPLPPTTTAPDTTAGTNNPGTSFDPPPSPIQYEGQPGNTSLDQGLEMNIDEGNSEPRKVPTTIKGDIVEFQRSVFVRGEDITIYVYDHEIEDGDTVSVNVNGVWILNRYELKNKGPQTETINLTLQKGVENYLVSKAWNTGTMFPNTLTLEIHDGTRRAPQRVQVNSEVGKSGAIRIIYRK